MPAVLGSHADRAEREREPLELAEPALCTETIR